jgi:hypothetical protein
MLQMIESESISTPTSALFDCSPPTIVWKIEVNIGLKIILIDLMDPDAMTAALCWMRR